MIVAEAAVLAPREMRIEWGTDAGPIVITYPSNLSNADLEDVDDLFSAVMSSMTRRARLEGQNHGIR